MLLLSFEKKVVDDVVYLYSWVKGKLICSCSNPCQDVEESDFLVVKFLQRWCDVNVVWQKPNLFS